MNIVFFYDNITALVEDKEDLIMGNKKYPTIAILMGDNYTEYANELIKGFYVCAQREKVNLIFLMRSSLPRDTNAVLSDMTGEDFQVHFSSIYDYVPLVKPDALILAYGSLSIFSDPPKKEELLDFYRNIPCLLLKDVSDNPDIPYLVADNYTGMYECVEHLVKEHGYKKIAFLGGPVTNHDSNERLRAYKDVMDRYGLTVTETMIAHGDYSEFVEAQVEYLLDSNPGLEAIAFANDNMAKAGYSICEARGLVVGRDLAITGYDDVNFAKTINPPLTSVMHSSYLFSYQALQNALRLAKGEKAIYSKLPTVFHARSSCGCKSFYGQAISAHVTQNTIAAYVYTNIERMVDEFFFSMPYQEEKREYKDLLIKFFDEIVTNIFENNVSDDNFSSQFPYLKKLCEHPHVSPVIMLDHVVLLLRKLMSYVPEEAKRFNIQSIIASAQQYVHSAEILKLQSREQFEQHQKWFTNSFTQDLLAPHMSLEESLLCIMNRLRLMNIESCYFFLLSDPADCATAYHLEAPKHMFLTAYYDGDVSVVLEKSERVRLTEKNGVADILPKDKAQVLTTYVLFSEKTQYGFMLCKNLPEDILFMLACSLQIGAFLRFYHLNAKEREVRKELEESLALIKEQNSILNFVSEYDELTKLLNRRGFMEKTLKAMNENDGKTAYMISADLDHLKEVNDSFGHNAGDFALKTAGEYLNNSLPENAVIGRIGGDEFAAFVVSEEEDFIKNTEKALKEYSERFNRDSSKPYYIEMSMGIHKCSIKHSLSITALLDKSDTLLYKEKVHRRSTIKK